MLKTHTNYQLPPQSALLKMRAERVAAQSQADPDIFDAIPANLLNEVRMELEAKDSLKLASKTSRSKQLKKAEQEKNQFLQILHRNNKPSLALPHTHEGKATHRVKPVVAKSYENPLPKAKPSLFMKLSEQESIDSLMEKMQQDLAKLQKIWEDEDKGLEL